MILFCESSIARASLTADPAAPDRPLSPGRPRGPCDQRQETEGRGHVRDRASDQETHTMKSQNGYFSSVFFRASHWRGCCCSVQPDRSTVLHKETRTTHHGSRGAVLSRGSTLALKIGHITTVRNSRPQRCHRDSV